MNITIKLDGVDISAKRGRLLSDVLSLHGAETEMPCGRHGKCGKCRVIAHGMLSEPTANERMLLGEEAIGNGVRLACLTRAEGDCTVITQKRSESRVLIDGEMPELEIKPTFSGYGVAIDIGTTTLAARLFDEGGRRIADAVASNPQGVFGADVISRMESALKGNAEDISKVTVEACDSLIGMLSESAGISSKEIGGGVITGNTVMLHLLTRTDVEPLTHAPFEARRLFGEVLTARELGLCSLGAEVEIYLPSCIAAFIGADTTSAMLGSSLAQYERSEILCDIGTNGETVFSDKGELFACSTAAGPAFEGAGIRMGMVGRVGAIDHVSIVDGRLCAHVIGDVKPTGICGSGVVDAVACLLELGIIDETGYLEGGEAEISDGVVLTQEDIRKVQLAKSAIHAGIRSLLISAKTDISKVDTLLIAGGFGSYLDTDNAIRIGLLPSELRGRIRSVGNAALTGASMLLLNGELRDTAKNTVLKVQVRELSGDQVFADEYIERMMFE